jgi:hypothetical protein
MAFRTKKISQMDPKGSNLASTDLLEISQLVSGSYVTKSITGAEIISGATTGFVPTSRTLTINGTTQDLSADRTFTISTGITIGTTAITSGTVGRVLFEGTGNVVQESANLFWDNTNGRLGIGTSTPTNTLHIYTSVANYGCRLQSNATGANLIGTEYLWDATQLGTFSVNGGSGEFKWFMKSGGFFPTIYSNGVERLRIATTGNVLINTTTDAGFKLDVNGTARVASDAVINTLKIGRGLNSLSRNVMFGDVAGSAITTGSLNTFIGTNNGGVNTTGQANTFIGDFAGNKNTTANNNTFVGCFAGSNNIVGIQNTILGTLAGQNFTSSNNTFIGFESGKATTSGASNIAIGSTALSANITGSSNTSVGNSSLFSHTNGGSNSAFGLNSLYNITTGSNNVAIGSSSGQLLIGGGNLTSASNSTFLGYATKSLANGSTNEIIIGYNAEGAGSNTATLGNTSIVDTFLKGRINVQQYATGSRPTYVKGALIYDSTLSKLVVGGASGWEVVTSI